MQDFLGNWLQISNTHHWIPFIIGNILSGSLTEFLLFQRELPYGVSYIFKFDVHPFAVGPQHLLGQHRFHSDVRFLVGYRFHRIGGHRISAARNAKHSGPTISDGCTCSAAATSLQILHLMNNGHIVRSTSESWNSGLLASYSTASNAYANK